MVLILASALNGGGEFAAARVSAQRAREMAQDRLGEFSHSYQLGLALVELGIAEAGLKNVDSARESLRLAVANFRDAVGDGAPDTRRASARLLAIGA